MYCGYITRLKNVREHSNADKLQVAEVFGNSVVIGLNMQEGDLVLYFPTDGKLGLEFAKENNLLRISGSDSGGYMDADKRNVTSIKLRGEKSDGLIMDLESLSKFTNISTLKEGDTITTLKGITICEKYIPTGKKVNIQNQPKSQQKKIPKDTFPLFEQHSDTSQLAYNMNSFKEGDTCYITLKLHGTSARTSNTIKESKVYGIFEKLNKLITIVGIKNFKPKKNWEYISGTRRVILKKYDGGFYGGNHFRQQWHDFFVGKLHKGESVYMEIVGYTNTGQLIMPECDNKKTKDKEFIRQYGEKTRFTYGCEEGQSDIFVYRMTKTDEYGVITEYPTELVQLRCEQMGVKFTPILDKFLFTTQEDLMERVNKYGDGIDPIGKTHLREGVIVRIDNKEKFTALKHKNWEFKVLEGIIKSEDVLDMEEAESNGYN